MSALKRQVGKSALDMEIDHRFSWFRSVGHSLIIIVVGALLLLTVLLALYLQEKSSVRESAAAQAELHVKVQNKIFSEEFHKLVRGIYLLAQQSDLKNPVETVQGKRAVAESFLSFLKAYDDIDQLRLLDLNGRELVRVNYNGGSPEVVPDGRLQDKSDRYYIEDMHRYFKPISELGRNQVYISRLDLNVERGQLETPAKPTIRLGIAVYDHAGKPSGYLMLNYLAAVLLEQFRQASKLINGDVQLIDSNGSVLASGESAIPDMQQGVAGELVTLPDSRVDKGSDTFVAGRIDPAGELDVIPSEHGVAADPGYFWMIVVKIGEQHVARALVSYQLLARDAYLTAILILVIFSFPLGILLERRRIHTNHIRMLHQAVESTGEAVMVTDPESRIEYVNAGFARLTGYPPEEAVGMKPSQLVKSSAQDPEFYQELWETITAGKQWNGYLINRRKDGTLFPAAVSITPVLDAAGGIMRYVAVLRDDSEHKLLMEKNSQEARMQSLNIAIGGIAHEFNNILAGVMGNAYLLKNLEKENPDILTKLSSIENLGDRAAGMIRQMLAFVGHEQLELAEQDARQLFVGAAGIGDRLVSNGCEIIRHFEAVNAIVLADALQLQNVVDQLISNALDAVAGRDRPLITLTLGRVVRDDGEGNRKAYICFSVRDNGEGIAEEHRPLLFEPFFTTKEPGSGTGLGLSSAYGIIQKHHGIIEVESEVGKGCTFSVLLPVSREAGSVISDNI